MPKVSVIVPAYNAMTYLPKTMGSILAQTFADFEVVVVNDGSVDDTAAWVIQLAQTESRVRLISQENQGLALARNAGIAAAQGTYIAFMDADDLWEKTKLAKQVACLDTNPEVGLVYTWVAKVDAQEQPTGRILKHQIEGKVWTELIQHNIVECGSVPMVRRACFDAVGLFDPQLTRFNVNEDWDMWLRIADRYLFAVIQEPLVLYRQLTTGGSRNWDAVADSNWIVLEKAFAEAQPDRLKLKKRCYGLSYLCLAWKPLQCVNTDYRKSQAFREQAIARDPSLRFTWEYVRLSVAIASMRWLGTAGHQKFLGLFYAVRQKLVALSR